MNRFQTDSKKNFVNFKSTEYDELWKATQATQDAAEKAADYKKLQTIIADEAASAFIQVPANTTAFNKNLAGYKFYPIYVQDMSTVYFVK